MSSSADRIPAPSPWARRFEERVVVVTGAGSGIGEGIARWFSAEGANVVLAGRHRDKLDRVAQDLPAERTLVQVGDVKAYPQVEALVKAAVDRFGRLDVLVNNAGIAPEGTVTQASLADWEATMATNAGGVFHGCRAAMPHLLRTRGCIVNIASVSGLGGDWGLSFYNASKGAIINFTRALALDHGRDGVRVNAVCPSFTLTPMTEDMQDDPAMLARFAERMPLGRPATPADVAAVVAFLASADAAMVTGVALPVDGGVTASNGQPNMG
ncbi:SDR family NAD(P)-dependent oxidoreductase [Ramlibacter rhizophilus]|uniref:SDR family oxidoreductase n=1 Tax=Ramlibacter rhizophilus TaxID=1781167 RepID=A0A4Z0BJT9_9BURK|nr:SDR family oxidoreductase [Ramlibacter rhizophilus]TFY98689.1 SDR family oxidoreductase [Ramlibacter rhizophilus]